MTETQLYDYRIQKLKLITLLYQWMNDVDYFLSCEVENEPTV